MTNEKDAGKEQEQVEFKTTNQNRVVLNLTTEQAEQLKNLLYLDGVAKGSKFEHYEIANKLCKRLERTILKQAFIKKCEEDGFKPTREQIKNFMGGLK